MNKYFKYLRILVAVILLCSLGLSLNTVEVGATAVTLYESCTTVQDGDSSAIYGGNCVAMQFTSDATTQGLTTAVAHTVTSVWLYLKRTGSPGTFYVYMYEASAGLPPNTPGSYIAIGSYDGNDLTVGYDYVDIPMVFGTSGSAIKRDTQYAIVVKAPNGGIADYIEWGTDTGGGLANAESSHTTNGGTSWTSDAPVDALFQVYGSPVLEIRGANVFQNYLTTGDLLVCAEVINGWPPYATDGTAPQSCFQVQLIALDGTTVLAAVPMVAWGYRPESVYLAPSAVTSLTIGAAYIVRVQGLIGSSPPSVDYTLVGSGSVPSDWKGTDLKYLDTWIINTATKIQTYEGTGVNSIVTGTTDGGQVLTDIGGAMFTSAIPGISQVRPSIFMVPKSKPIFPTTTNAATYDSSKNYQTLLGTSVANDLDTFGDLFNISGQNFGGLLVGLLIAFVVLVGLILGGRAAIPIFVIAGVPLMFIGNYVGVLGIQWTLILAFIFLAIFAWWFWPKG